MIQLHNILRLLSGSVETRNMPIRSRGRSGFLLWKPSSWNRSRGNLERRWMRLGTISKLSDVQILDFSHSNFINISEPDGVRKVS